MNKKFMAVKNRSAVFFNLLRQGLFIKAGNYLLTMFNMITRPDHASNYPVILIVEPGNICNLRCALCATGQKKLTRPQIQLTFAKFKGVLDQIGKYVINLDLYNWGEPFLNKDIFKMIAYAQKYRIHTEVSSNLNYYTPELGEQIIESGLNRLICSIHGGSSKTYSRYMVGGDFRKVIKNLKHLVALKKKYHLKKPIIRWRFVVFSHNQHEILKAKKMAQKIGADEFEPLPMKLDMGFDIDSARKSMQTKSRWIPTVRKYNLYDIKSFTRPDQKQLNCYWPWEIISVAAYGGVQPCCVFYDQKLDFGNIFKEDFWKIWNNKYYQTSRRILRQKILNNRETICGRCIASGFIAR